MGGKRKRRPPRTAERPSNLAERRGSPGAVPKTPSPLPTESAAPTTNADSADRRVERAELPDHASAATNPSGGSHRNGATGTPAAAPRDEPRDAGAEASDDDASPHADVPASERPTDWARLEQRWLVLFHVVVWGAAALLWLGRGGSGALELDSAGQVVAPSAVLPFAENAAPAPGEGTSGRASIAAEHRPAPRPPRLLVDVNAAPAEELALLPGVGETLAERIIAHRTAKGPFRRMDQLLDVPGLGPKTLERLKPLLVPLPVAGAK